MAVRRCKDCVSSGGTRAGQESRQRSGPQEGETEGCENEEDEGEDENDAIQALLKEEVQSGVKYRFVNWC